MSDEIPQRINSYLDYLFFLEADRLSLTQTRKTPRIIGDEIWKFQRLLRKIEYYKNCKKSIFWKIPFFFNYFLFYHLSMKLGYTIHPNCCGPGLAIVHRGTIVINDAATIGANCRIHTCVNIGATSGQNEAPVIGNNVYIAPGVKIFGGVHIADNIAIGANTVVNKSFIEPNITIAGVPAKKVSENGSERHIRKGTELARKTI
jgi:serine O-acetyltransferase